MRHATLIAAALIGILVAAPALASTKAKYDCKGGTVMTVYFKANSAKVIIPGAEAVTLPQVLSGDGFRYAKKSYELRGVGKKATWTTSRTTLSCKAR